ncbi:MAG: hypothetical protein RPU61_13990 [Candidatus Sedimenticola sp. (ex Thyasira tokunagai)]
MNTKKTNSNSNDISCGVSVPPYLPEAIHNASPDCRNLIEKIADKQNSTELGITHAEILVLFGGKEPQANERLGNAIQELNAITIQIPRMKKSESRIAHFLEENGFENKQGIVRLVLSDYVKHNLPQMRALLPTSPSLRAMESDKRVFDFVMQNGTSKSPFCTQSSTAY